MTRYPSAYRDRLDRMKSGSARARTQGGLELLAAALSDIGLPDTAMKRIGFEVGGRPQIAGAPAFSISHSRALIACAIDDAPLYERTKPRRQVGLDVEARRPIVPERLRRLMSAAEAAEVEAAPERFFDFWCAREATVKASGRVGLKRICELTLAADHACLDGLRWPLKNIDILPGYATCIASDAPIGKIRLRALTLPVSA